MKAAIIRVNIIFILYCIMADLSLIPRDFNRNVFGRKSKSRGSNKLASLVCLYVCTAQQNFYILK